MTRYHLDTSFLIDWQRGDFRIARLRDEILNGDHEITFDPIVETEYVQVPVLTREAELLFESIETLGSRVDLSSGICRQAAMWLAPMDTQERKQHFGDALIAAAATRSSAIVLAADKRIGKVFPVAVETY